LCGQAPANNGSTAPPSPTNNGGAAPTAGSGTQFITGLCANDAESSLGCCSFKMCKCIGTVIALEHNSGCGFGNPTHNDNTACKFCGDPPGAPGGAPPANNSGATGSAAGSSKPPGTQFITGLCANNTECNSDCCGFNTEKCASAIIVLECDSGCGFGNPTPNDAACKIHGQ
ncbi:hypothetical protein V5O48_009510, partial [Marasmius crinis-equi]